MNSEKNKETPYKFVPVTANDIINRAINKEKDELKKITEELIKKKKQ